MRHAISRCRCFVALLVLFAAAVPPAGASGPTLELTQFPGPGSSFALSVSGLGAAQLAGYQVFLEFDATRLHFVAGAYVTNRLGLGIVNPIVTNGNQIVVAAGINQFIGQTPTNADQDLVYLSFVPVGTGCSPRVRIRTDTIPPTRLTDATGQPIPIGVVQNPWPACPADFNNDGHVSVQDIFDFLNAWFRHDCSADFNGVGGVTVQDIFDFLAAWFSGC